ncbi:6-phospho-3-hexuloisomerase [Microbacterium sp. ISL-103]|jgi:6-phospho-3-hexuloisomerase|uniref:6-phospho-3-hexuloisomerase n=1 Tax=Microbacterium sp. ISL-103 TaxID=2819156 RepID=UPI002035F51A|nr:6-phospho-3-hexuloisomerase [Microbacterium sp. ISL-103]
MDVMEVGLGHSLGLVSTEVSAVLESVIRTDPVALGRVADLVAEAPRVFVLGAGRSGLALQMTAMRLMHLGLDVHVVGETTTPAISRDDLLLVASGSGTTSGIVRAAQTAVGVGAKVATITTDGSSPLAALSGAASIVVPAAGKLDRSGAASAQYAGSLFEQAVVLIGDALFHALWARSGQDADDLWPRHSNLE